MKSDSASEQPSRSAPPAAASAPGDAAAAAAVTWISGYGDVQDAFKRNGLRMASYDGAKSTVFADVLITLDGPEHLTRRRYEARLVRPAMVALLEHEIVPGAARRLLAAARDAGEGDLVGLAKEIASSMSGRLVGLDIGEDRVRLAELAVLMARLHEGVVIEWSTRPREVVLADVRAALAEYRSRFFEPALRRREAAGGQATADGEALDLLSLLVQHRDALGLDEDKMLRESVHFLAATAHTTATVVMHACHETWRWVADHPEDADRLADPLFLQACVGEAMRLWPPSGWAYRVATQDVTLGCGRAVATGEKLGLHLIHANRDTTVFGTEVDRFDPRRSTPPRVSSYGLAFGAGAHVCLGRRLAAGADGDPQGPGTLAATLREIFAAGARPHPARPPVLQEGTERHQFRSYPLVFGAPLSRTDAAGARPLAEVR